MPDRGPAAADHYNVETSPYLQDMTAHLTSELSQSGLICFTGADSRSFLHNQLTCDVTALSPTSSQYGGYCTPKGRLLATFLLWQRGEDYYLQLPQVLREAVQKQLTKFILRSKVKATDATAGHVQFGVSGDGAGKLLEGLFGSLPTAPHQVVHAADATLIMLPVHRYLVVAPVEKAPTIADALKKCAASAATAVWDWLDIRAGVPVILPATLEQFVPQMVNLDLIGGVSFGKGCYPGQEIVARMHFLGRLKQRMFLVHIEAGNAPQAGDKLYSPDFGEQSCGMIVNAGPAPEGGFDALAVMQIDQARERNVHWRATDGPPLKLLKLPYSLAAA
jgi:folate-binding protein YgfZ